jgi:hypothetical protein
MVRDQNSGYFSGAPARIDRAANGLERPKRIGTKLGIAFRVNLMQWDSWPLDRLMVPWSLLWPLGAEDS